MDKDEINRRYGPQPNERDPFKRKCRLLQSWYRVEKLKQQDCGPWQPGGLQVGSSLVNGEQSRANFISPAALACAFDKLAEKEEDSDITIDRERLFNNMLSSQPMCFNLFGDFRVGVSHENPNAGQVLAAILGESSRSLFSDVEIEMFPRPDGDPKPNGNYIYDKTAFDAAVLFKDGEGRQSLASIETKYTDKLGGNEAHEQDRQKGIAEDLRLFNEKGREWDATHDFDQVVRNLLLTIEFGRRRGLARAVNYVPAPEEDKVTPKLIEELIGRLSVDGNQIFADRYCDCIKFLTLEMVVCRGLQVADPLYGEHLWRFFRRYFGFVQILHLLS